jgi:hypothetical protein
MATYMVVNGRNAGNFGFGNAVAVVIFVISLVVALIYQRFVLRRDTAGAITEGRRPDERAHRRHPRSTATWPPRPAAGSAPHEERCPGAALVVLHRSRRHRAHARAGAVHHHRRLPHNSQITVDPRLARSVERAELRTCSPGRSSGARCSTRSSPPVDHGRCGRPRADGQLRHRPVPFRGRGVLYALFAAGLMFPITVAITPLYIVIRNLGLMNSSPASSCRRSRSRCRRRSSSSCRSCGRSRTRSGGGVHRRRSRLGFFWRMVLPLSVPGVITVGILAFIGSWNSYLLPLFILNNEASFTLPLGVQAFSSQYSVDTAKVLAFTSLSMLPALLFFSLFERRIVGGLTGAVKG